MNATALYSIVTGWSCVSETHRIPALKATVTLEVPEPDRKKPLPLSACRYSRAAHSFAVSLARLRERLHKDSNAAFLRRYGHTAQGRRRRDQGSGIQIPTSPLQL